MSRYTKIAILQTFEQMLEEMAFEKITVTALVKRCQISSNTFYYHFRDIYDLLDAWMMDKKRYLADSMEPGASWDAMAKHVLHYIKDHEILVHHVFDSISQDLLKRYVFDSLENTFYNLVCAAAQGISLPEDTMRYISNFCCYSFTGFVLKFIWAGMTDDIDESVDKLSDIFNGMAEYVAWKAALDKSL